MKVQKHYWKDTKAVSYEYLLITQERFSFFISFFLGGKNANISDEFDYIYNPNDEYEPTDSQKHMAIKRIFVWKWWWR